jgi:hypothetical protein
MSRSTRHRPNVGFAELEKRDKVPASRPALPGHTKNYRRRAQYPGDDFLAAARSFSNWIRWALMRGAMRCKSPMAFLMEASMAFLLISQSCGFGSTNRPRLLRWAFRSI